MVTDMDYQCNIFTLLLGESFGKVYEVDILVTASGMSHCHCIVQRVGFQRTCHPHFVLVGSDNQERKRNLSPFSYSCQKDKKGNKFQIAEHGIMTQKISIFWVVMS
jgi:hypothetical protein